MKKILTVVLALVLVCGLAVTAMATGFGVETDKDIIEAGEEVTVTVTLDETITADQGATALGGELNYDESAVTLVAGSAKASDAYSFVTVTESKKAPQVKMAWFSVTSTPIDLPAGTIMTVSFTANSELSAAAVEAAFSLDLAAQSALGEVVVETKVAASITVCAGHSWSETGRTGSCTEDGEVSYACGNCGATYTETFTATGHVHTGMEDWSEMVYNENYDIVEVIQHTCCDVCFEDISTVSYTGVNLAIDENWELILPPVMVPSETPEVAPGETANLYLNNFGGMIVLIYGEDITVSVSTPGSMWDPTMTTVEYTPVDGVVTIPVPSYAAFVTITNNGTEAASYSLEAYIPEGDMMNPIIADGGEHIIHVSENDQDGMFVEFTATCTGWVNITVSGDYWNFNTYYDGDPETWEDDHYGYYYFDVPEDGDTDRLFMHAGETVRINLGASYVIEGETMWDNEWVYPEADLTLSIIPEYTHEGHIVHVEAVEPGCHFTGNVEHWYCANCETVWTDAELTQVSNHMNVIVPELGGDVIHVEAKDPTCYEDGNIEHWYCETCEQVWQDEARTQLTNHKNVILGATGHQNIVHMEAVEPGCHYTGNIEHWYCTDCDTVWTDAEMTQISNHLNVIIPATGEGNVAHIDAVDPGCHMDGNIEYWVCYTCEQVWQDEALTQKTNIKNVVLPATGEGNLVHFEAIAPGCHMDGNIEYWVCYTCEQVWQDEALTQLTNIKNVVLPAVGGDVIHVEAKDATCAEDGCIEHWYCEQCELVWQDEACTQLTNHKNVIIAATGHVYGEDGVCSVCGDNPKAGDTTISLVVAAAVISALSIVALPIVKKHF